jgi:hypothetical protein
VSNIRLPRSVCAAVNDILQGSHASLEALFVSCGAPLPPPQLSHSTKWKEWLYLAGMDPDADSLEVLGGVLEESMDVAPGSDIASLDEWKKKRDRVVRALEENGLRYYRGGRVLPTGQMPEIPTPSQSGKTPNAPAKPTEIGELLERLIKGLRRAMHPLAHRRRGAQALSFATEYDVQDLLHALLRPWIADIRPEEYTPSYAGTSTRMDFLLPQHKIALELKFVRDSQHARKIGNEIIVDIEHYRRHPNCHELWCVIFDPDHLLVNAQGLTSDLEGDRTSKDGKLTVKAFVL